MSSDPVNFIVVPMAEEHLEAVAQLERLCFTEPWSVKALELLLGDRAVGYVCLNGTHVVAYGGMLYAPGEGQITNIAVHPDVRRKGCGSAVLQALLADAEKQAFEQISLEVRQSNAAAIALYECAGFYTAGCRKRFYRNPSEDALVMLKMLP